MLDFPSNPTVGQTYTAAGVTWVCVAPNKWAIASGGTIGPVSVYQQVFTASGTYTPSAGLIACVIECVGGGGGGGGVPASTANNAATGSGGGAGGYSRALKTAAQIGASQTVTIGAAGAAGAAGVNTGGAGGATSVGSLVLANGGGGGQTMGSSTNFYVLQGGSGGQVAGAVGDIVVQGNSGEVAVCGSGSGGALAFGSNGGGSYFGGGGSWTGPGSGTYGSGGVAGASRNGSAAMAGYAGGTGLVVITEYCLNVGAGGAGFLTVAQGAPIIATAGSFVSVHNSASQAYSSGATIVNYDTVEFDTNNEFNASTHVFTAKRAGYYRATGIVAFATSSSGAVHYSNIYKNGAQYALGVDLVPTPGLGCASLVDTILHLLVGDTVDMRVVCGAAGTINADPSYKFQVQLLALG